MSLRVEVFEYGGPQGWVLSVFDPAISNTSVWVHAGYRTKAEARDAATRLREFLQAIKPEKRPAKRK